MGTKLFDQEARGNLLLAGSDQEVGRVIPLFAEDVEDDLLVLARSLRVDREEEVFEVETDEGDFGPDLALFEGEGQGEDEERAAALKLLAAAGVFSLVAVGQAIVNGPLPFK